MLLFGQVVSEVGIKLHSLFLELTNHPEAMHQRTLQCQMYYSILKFLIQTTKRGSPSKSFRPRNATPIKKRFRSAAQIAGLQKAIKTRRKNIQARKDRAAEYKRQMDLLKAREAAIIAIENAPYGNLIIDETTGQNVSLDEQETKEVDEILSSFFQSGNGYYKVIKIERILNSELDRQYEAHRQQLERKKHPTDEVLMFHGTAHRNIPRLKPHL